MTIEITKVDNGWILKYRNPVEYTEVYTVFSMVIDKIAAIHGITKVGQTWEMYLNDRRNGDDQKD